MQRAPVLPPRTCAATGPSCRVAITSKKELDGRLKEAFLLKQDFARRAVQHGQIKHRRHTHLDGVRDAEQSSPVGRELGLDALPLRNRLVRREQLLVRDTPVLRMQPGRVERDALRVRAEVRRQGICRVEPKELLEGIAREHRDRFGDALSRCAGYGTENERGDEESGRELGHKFFRSLEQRKHITPGLILKRNFSS